MTPPNFVFYVTCLMLGNLVRLTQQNFSITHKQERRFVSAIVGQRLTLQCFYETNDATRFYWYKQSLGQKPKLISTQYVFKANGTFHDEFENNPRFTLDTEIGKNHLYITDLEKSDSGTYYCARRVSLVLEFAEGTTVSVKGSGLTIKALVQQSASETIQPGGSVTLNCTVHTGTCDEDHSVYWFKDSGDFYPGLLYTHGGRNDQCEKNEQTYNCTYNLPVKSINVSHAGTYYCAVASCGHILFGEGTTLKYKDKNKSHFLVYFLSGALAFTFTVVVSLTFVLYKMNKRKSFQSEAQARFSAPSVENAHTDNLHYASINVNISRKSKKERNSKTECVYSSVKQ
ncbi:immunoglobulin kappa light chain isoform X3 [Oreochromis niloticus]|uniref:Immunoglobulin kappa light chain n=1 Tax=Oreochromis niloticus TaxID=8128 RepID=A0A669B963_ORENI|nr:immunoglobulin kappa light chain isoform X3 [Oreochromis niloticus]